LLPAAGPRRAQVALRGSCDRAACRHRQGRKRASRDVRVRQRRHVRRCEALQARSSRVTAPSSSPAPRSVYLDWNATAPPHPLVLARMLEVAEDGWANPASVHAPGRRARAIVEDARAAIGRLVGRDSRDVFFTSGGTEANNLALAGAPGIVTSRLEHPSVVRVAEAAEARGVPLRWLSA